MPNTQNNSGSFDAEWKRRRKSLPTYAVRTRDADDNLADHEAIRDGVAIPLTPLQITKIRVLRFLGLTDLELVCEDR